LFEIDKLIESWPTQLWSRLLIRVVDDRSIFVLLDLGFISFINQNVPSTLVSLPQLWRSRIHLHWTLSTSTNPINTQK